MACQSKRQMPQSGIHPGERIISNEHPEHLSPKLARLYGYWLERHRPGGCPPRRGDIDPTEIARAAPDLLPHLWMVDVLRDPYRFRYRLVGGAVIEAGSPARVGDIIEPGSGREGTSNLYDNLVRVCEQRCWNYRSGVPTLLHSKYVEQIERLSLPLADDEGRVSIVLSASLYSWQTGRGGTRK